MRNVMFLCIILSVMCFCGCDSNSVEKASLRSLSETDIEGYIFTESEAETIDGIRMISKKDTEVLKSLLDKKMDGLNQNCVIVSVPMKLCWMIQDIF